MVQHLDDVWKALSNPLRRNILDSLREGPKSVGDLCLESKEFSRFAVMQHLGVLERAGLVLVRREGRRCLNYLNAVPLRELYERWVTDYASEAAKSALVLKRFVEKKEIGEKDMEAGADKVVKIEQEIRLAAPQEKVFAALTVELDSWWAFRFRPDSKIIVEPWVGGRCFEDWGDGQGALFGMIVWYEPPYKFASSNPSAMSKGYSSFDVQTVEPDGDGCIYKKSLTLWGNVPPEVEKMFADGTKAILQKLLREYVEEGKRYIRPQTDAANDHGELNP